MQRDRTPGLAETRVVLVPWRRYYMGKVDFDVEPSHLSLAPILCCPLWLPLMNLGRVAVSCNAVSSSPSIRLAFVGW